MCRCANDQVEKSLMEKLRKKIANKQICTFAHLHITENYALLPVQFPGKKL